MSTTLNGSILSTDTTIAVVSAAGFTSAGVILIDFEEISYTGIAGNSFTGCTRGADGTTAAGHSNGVAVSQVVLSTLFTADNYTIANPKAATVRIIASGIVVPGKRQATSSGPSGGAFASNSIDYTMRGFHVQLNRNVTWKAPFNDVNGAQFFGNGGTAGTLTNVVILSRK